MGFRKLITSIAITVLTLSVCRADDVLHIDDAQNLNGMQQPWDLLPVEQAAYAEVTDMDQNFACQPNPDEINIEPGIGCCDTCGHDECQCRDFDYCSGWTFGFDISAMQSNVPLIPNRAYPSSTWTDETGTATRWTLGYEWSNGFGIRAQSWRYALNGTVYQNTYSWNLSTYNHPVYYGAPIDLDLRAETSYFDFYKKIRSENGELLIGAGPAFGRIKMFFNPSNQANQYEGTGISLFGQGFNSFLHYERWNLGVTGQARMTLLTGEWRNFASYSSTHPSKSMSIVELTAGLELRRRFGRGGDHYWFVRAMPEFQQWYSDGMGPLGGDTLALNGASCNFGVTW